MRLPALVAVMLLGFSALAAADPHRCGKQAVARMAQLDVPESEIKKIVFSEVREDDRSNRLLGYDAWVELKQCRGSVVINMSRDCEIKQTYTRGACKITGLKSYR